MARWYSPMNNVLLSDPGRMYGAVLYDDRPPRRRRWRFWRRRPHPMVVTFSGADDAYGTIDLTIDRQGVISVGEPRSWGAGGLKDLRDQLAEANEGRRQAEAARDQLIARIEGMQVFRALQQRCRKRYFSWKRAEARAELYQNVLDDVEEHARCGRADTAVKLVLIWAQNRDRLVSGETTWERELNDHGVGAG